MRLILLDRYWFGHIPIGSIVIIIIIMTIIFLYFSSLGPSFLEPQEIVQINCRWCLYVD